MKNAYINKLIGYENGKIYFRGICDMTINKRSGNIIRPYNAKVFGSTEPISLEDFLSGQASVSELSSIGFEYTQGMFLKGIATSNGFLIPDNLIARYQSLLSILFKETVLDVTLTPRTIFKIIKCVKDNSTFINTIFPQDICFDGEGTDLFFDEKNNQVVNIITRDFYAPIFEEGKSGTTYKLASDCHVRGGEIFVKCEGGDVDINTYLMSVTVKTTNCFNKPSSVSKNGVIYSEFNKIDFVRKHIRNNNFSENYAFEKIPLLNSYSSTFGKYFKNKDFLFNVDTRFAVPPSVCLENEDTTHESEVFLSTKKTRYSDENTAIISRGVAKMFLHKEEAVEILNIKDASTWVINLEEVKSWINGKSIDSKSLHLTETGISTVGKELLPGDFIYFMGNQVDDDREFIYKNVPQDVKGITIKEVVIFAKEKVYKTNAYVRLLVAQCCGDGVRFLEDNEDNDVVIYITYEKERNLVVGDYISTRYGIGGFITSIIDIDEPIVTFGFVDEFDEESKVINQLEKIYKQNCEFVEKNDFASLKQSLCKHFLLDEFASEQEALNYHYLLIKDNKYVLQVKPGETFLGRFLDEETSGTKRVVIGVSEPRYYTMQEAVSGVEKNNSKINFFV